MRITPKAFKWIFLVLVLGWVLGDGRHKSLHQVLWSLAILAAIAIFWLILDGMSNRITDSITNKVAGDTRDLKKRIDRIGENYVAKRPNSALVIALYQRGNRYCKGFGKISDEDSRPPDERTIFEIGSITKVFTGIALARMAGAGALKLNDPVNRLLPEGVHGPKGQGGEATLEHLATHTSGLPRLPENFNGSMKDKLNPYAHYTTEDLCADLAVVKLQRPPGRVSVYSNYGFGLLGKILEWKSGKTYEALVQEEVCAPLGLVNTTINLSEQQRKSLTPGHNIRGQVVPNWGGDTLAGCGRLYSNAEDLMKFIEANLKDGDSEISRALQEAQAVHFKGPGRDVGLGWQITKGSFGGNVIHWHNGGTGGYVSFTGFDKVNQIGVVVLSNYGAAMVRDSSTDQIGMNLLSLGERVSLE